MSLFGENLGRDDQFIYARGGGYDVFKVQFYSDRMPHNLSFNALTPLNWPGSSLQPAPAGAYPPATNPATWNNFEYGLQRNTIGGNVEVNAQVAVLLPRRLQRGADDGHPAVERPARYRLRQRADRVRRCRPTTRPRTRCSKAATRARTGTSSSPSSTASSAATRATRRSGRNFYMRSALDTSLQPQDNELQKWSLNFAMRDLWLDSTMLVRLTQSKLTSDFGVESAGLKPVSTATQAPAGIPAGVGYLVHRAELVDVLRRAQDDDGDVLAAVDADGGPEHAALLRVLRQAERLDADQLCGGRAAVDGSAVHAATRRGSAWRRTRRPSRFEYTKNEYGLDANYGIGRYGKLLGGINFVYTDRNLEPAPKTDDMRIWAEWRASMGDTLSGRLKYQFLQRDSDLNPSYTNNASNVPADDGPVLLQGLRRRQLRPEHGQVQRRLESDGAAHRRARGDVAEDRLQGLLLRPQRRHQPAVRPDGHLRQRGQVPADRHRQLGRGRVQPGVPQHRLRPEPAPGRTADGDDVRLGHQEHPEELAGRAAGRLDGHRQAEADGVGKLVRDQRRRRLLVGQLCRCRRLQRRPAGQLHHRQHPDRPLPDQGRVPDQQELERHGRLLVREVRLRRRPDARVRELLPVLPEPGRDEQHLEQRRVHQPQLHQQHLLHHGQVQLRHAADRLRGWRRLRPRLRWRGPRRRRPRRHPRPLRRPRRRCRRSRWTRRCCSTSTRRC